MSKEEFLRKLRKKIEILEEIEVEDIIEEYSGFIDEKVNQGFTEEEAVKSMGNINELARELLSAYKIKNTETKSGEVLNSFIDEFLRIAELIIDIFANKSFKEIIRFIIEIICIFIIIAICKIPFWIIKLMGGEILRELSTIIGSPSIYYFIANIGNFFLEMCYLIFAVILFIKLFQKKFLNNTKWVVEEKKTEKQLYEKEYKSLNIDKNIKKNIERVKVHEYHGFGIIDGLTNICVAFFKIIAFCIFIGVICYVIGMTTVFGLCMYLLIRGVFYFGIYILVLSLLVLGVIAFIVLFNFIFNRKSSLRALLIASLSCFLLLGIGVAVCAVDVANTSINYVDKITEEAVETFEYQMTDNLIFESYYDEYVIDESLGDTIKVEYIYNNNFIDLTVYQDTYTRGDYEFLYSYYDVIGVNYDKSIFNQIIEDLKNKKISSYSNDIKIILYTSSSVKEKLTKNYRKYESNNNCYENNDLENSCLYFYENGYTTPDVCIPYLPESNM